MITLYHAPRSRSSRIIWLLEELGCEYKIELVSILRGDGSGAAAPDSYAAINPLKKVPTVKVFEEVVYESGAICLYLTDSHPRKDIGPLGRPPPESFSRMLRKLDKSVPVPLPCLKSMASLRANSMMSSILSPTAWIKQAEHCGYSYWVAARRMACASWSK